MIIECPNCGTKYKVSREAVHPKGRTVRCASCGNKWYETGQTFDAVEPAMTSASSGSLVEDAPYRDEVRDEPRDGVDTESDSADDQRRTPTEEAESLVEEPEGLTASRADAAPPRLPAPERQASRLVPRTVAALLAAVFMASLIVPTVLFRHEIIAAWPPAGRIVALVHPAPRPPGADLMLRDVHSALRTEDKGPMLSIDGLIEASAKDKTAKIIVPPIRATLRKDGMEIKSWVFQSGITTVSAREPARFSTTLDGAGASEGDIELTFAAESDLPKEPGK